MIEEGRWDDMLNVLPIHKGDFFQIDSGTVHAIKTGTLILETQQSSDVTYRLYDYDRPGTDGKLRPLHIEQSLDCIDFNAQAPTDGTVTAPEVDGVTELESNPLLHRRSRARQRQQDLGAALALHVPVGHRRRGRRVRRARSQGQPPAGPEHRGPDRTRRQDGTDRQPPVGRNNNQNGNKGLPRSSTGEPLVSFHKHFSN